MVDYYAHRPQVQERLSLQILKELQDTLETENVIVMICAKHLCVSSRGIKDKSSFTSTTEYGGCFKKEEERANFFKIIESASGNNIWLKFKVTLYGSTELTLGERQVKIYRYSKHFKQVCMTLNKERN